ncbi:regulator of chromosome condensation 1/beta-lactamase-inhibitor protein II, partial [Baffinella frigidus]
VKCWGIDYYGELGKGFKDGAVGDQHGEMGDSLPFIDFGGNGRVVDIGMEKYAVCVVFESSKLKCFGLGSTARLGMGDNENRYDASYLKNENSSSFVQLGTNALGERHGVVKIETMQNRRASCVLLVDQTVKCWGWSSGGSLGIGDGYTRGDDPNEMGDYLPTINFGTETRVLNLWTASARDTALSCVLLNTGDVKCWGGCVNYLCGWEDSHNKKTIGDQHTDMGDNLRAVKIPEGRTVISMSICDHSVALLDDGSVLCWGDTSFGRCATGGVTDTYGGHPFDVGVNISYVDIGTNIYAKAISLKGPAICAVLSTDQIKCWGPWIGGGSNYANNNGDAPYEMGDNLPTVDLGTTPLMSYAGVGQQPTCGI